MTPLQYKACLKRHDIKIVRAGEYFGVSRRQAQRIASEGPIPKLVAFVLNLMDDGKIKKEDLL
jgi:hypothetical protein